MYKLNNSGPSMDPWGIPVEDFQAYINPDLKSGGPGLKGHATVGGRAWWGLNLFLEVAQSSGA